MLSRCLAGIDTDAGAELLLDRALELSLNAPLLDQGLKAVVCSPATADNGGTVSAQSCRICRAEKFPVLLPLPILFVGHVCVVLVQTTGLGVAL